MSDNRVLSFSFSFLCCFCLAVRGRLRGRLGVYDQSQDLLFISPLLSPLLSPLVFLFLLVLTIGLRPRYSTLNTTNSKQKPPDAGS